MRTYGLLFSHLSEQTNHVLFFFLTHTQKSNFSSVSLDVAGFLRGSLAELRRDGSAPKGVQGLEAAEEEKQAWASQHERKTMASCLLCLEGIKKQARLFKR